MSIKILGRDAPFRRQIFSTDKGRSVDRQPDRVRDTNKRMRLCIYVYKQLGQSHRKMIYGMKDKY